MRKLFGILYVQVLIAIVIGVSLGYFLPDTGIAMKPFGDGFIKLIKMVIAPVIFCTVALGISGMESLKSVGRTGAFAIAYFEILSTLALIIGLVIVNVLQPGAGMNIDPASLDVKSIAAYTGPGKMQTVQQFLLDIIPESFLGALTRGEILPVLLVAILTGFAMHLAGEKARAFRGFLEDFNNVIFRVVGIIMRAAPVGAFGAMAFVIGKYGISTLTQLGGLMACFYFTCIAFVLVVLGIVARLHGFGIWAYLRYIQEELLIVLGTSSSEAALPRMMVKMEALGAQRSVVGLVIPAGYSFNLDGTSIYLTMATVFIAQATNTPLDLSQQVLLLAVLLLTSKGAAGVTGSGFIVLAATLSTVGTLPVAGVALILGIDRFMSEARALTNLVGNGVATLVVARWCGALDREKLAVELANGPRDDLP